MKKLPLLISILILFLISNPAKAHAKNLKVHFIQSGYGDSILIQLPNQKNLLIDAGEKQFAQKIKKYLHRQGISKIDVAVISHPHKNHFGSFEELLKFFEIDLFITNQDKEGEGGYRELIQRTTQKKIPIYSLSKTDKFPNICPDTNVILLNSSTPSLTGNNGSLVLLLNYKNTSFLFSGDIEPSQQSQISFDGIPLNEKQCIQIPHHGGPMTDDFVRRFQDPIYVISTGKNPWGSPKGSDLKKLKGMLLRTDKHGDIVLESDGQEIKIIGPCHEK